MVTLEQRRLFFGVPVACLVSFIAGLTWPFWAFLTTAERIEMGIFLATAGTVISFIVFNFWDSYLEKPELEILHDSTDTDRYSPQLTFFFEEQSDGKITVRPRDVRFLRVRIHNAGSRTANRCFAQLELIERSKGTHTLSKVEKTLLWAEVPQFPNIPPKAKFPLNVAYSKEGLVLPFPTGCDGNVRAWIFTEQVFANPNFRMQDAMCLGEYLVRIIVYSDNAQPVEKKFVISVVSEWNKLNMRE